MIPIDMALSSRDGLEEEQRLFYVAVTRARDELHLYAPLRMPHHRRAHDDRHSFVQLSRFLEEERVTATLEASEEIPCSSSSSSVNRTTGSPVTINLDSLWR
jgi:DNA helicase-2/ATP-dependent DNA helicase PcrA